MPNVHIHRRRRWWRRRSCLTSRRCRLGLFVRVVALAEMIGGLKLGETVEGKGGRGEEE